MNTAKRPTLSFILITWLLLLVAMNALSSGLKQNVRLIQHADLFPVAVVSVTLGYAIGFSKRHARRAWIIALLGGLLVAFIESALLVTPLKTIVGAVPHLELDLLRWLFQKKDADIPFPDMSIFQMQFAQISANVGAFIARLYIGSLESTSVREFVWDLPLLIVAAWNGWWISRRGQVVYAFMPSLAANTYVLYIAEKSGFPLQIHTLIFLLLLGAYQPWNIISAQSNRVERAIRETRYTLIIFSIAIVALAGLTSSVFGKDSMRRLRESELGKALGLEREASGRQSMGELPRQHLTKENIDLSKNVVFAVKTGELPPVDRTFAREMVEAAPRHYWRWLTYDVYTGQGWATSTTRQQPYSSGQSLASVTQQDKLTLLQVQKSDAADKRLYWTGNLIVADTPLKVNWRIPPGAGPLVADMLGVLMDFQSYRAYVMLPNVSITQLRLSPTEYPLTVQQYLSLPESTPQRVLDLASQLTKNKNNPYDKAKAIEAHLRNYPYTLKVPPLPPDRDIADYFLFDLQTGYCDYYATTMIVLARAAGLPARLVVGYSSGAYDYQRAMYTIREENAHSWVEVYFTGIGWVEFEPTANQPPIILPETLPGEEDSYRGKFPVHQVNGYAKRVSFLDRVVYSWGFAFVSLCLALILWILYNQGFLRSHKTIGSIYSHVFYHGRKIYKDAPRNATPSMFAEKLKSSLETDHPWLNPARDEIESLTNLYLQEIYSAHPITQDEREAAVKTWRKLFWRLVYARMANMSLRVRRGEAFSPQ
jgi:hypothetical protein